MLPSFVSLIYNIRHPLEGGVLEHCSAQKKSGGNRGLEHTWPAPSTSLKDGQSVKDWPLKCEPERNVHLDCAQRAQVGPENILKALARTDVDLQSFAPPLLAVSHLKCGMCRSAVGCRGRDTHAGLGLGVEKLRSRHFDRIRCWARGEEILTRCRSELVRNRKWNQRGHTSRWKPLATKRWRYTFFLPGALRAVWGQQFWCTKGQGKLDPPLLPIRQGPAFSGTHHHPTNKQHIHHLYDHDSI